MIPKVIHYCWFGRNPLPKEAVKCIDSWRKFFPGYEIKEWNEDNFDINICAYVAEAYAQKKYAFVSDFARFWILRNYGGVYFDVDVEVIKDMTDIVEAGSFMGLENSSTPDKPRFRPAPGLGMGAEPGMPLLNELTDYYYGMRFDGLVLTIVDHTTAVLERYGLKEENAMQNVAGFNIYPSEYFCPINSSTGEMRITPHTVSIHHYAASWQPRAARWKKSVKKVIGPGMTRLAIRFKKLFTGKRS